ncbi:recombinase RecX [Lachnospiraceae bacterium oral taxon 096]|jgi:recX family|nr:recombinase RecX [Lachnospiraceae bacterium oral taxon 096]QUI94945.1 regulatory protein RecX [Lachnospiraceae bacterium oral taxon 096]
MLITQIIPIDKRRSKICADQDTFALYRGEIFRLGIKENEELSDEDYAIKVYPILKKRARERIVYILKDRDKTEAELRGKLRDGYYPNEVIDETIDWAKKLHYIDDTRYVDFYIRSNGERKSRKRMMYDLRQKGISPELLEEFLSLESVDERGQILRFLEKKKYDRQNSDWQQKRKLVQSLVAKGYSYDVILSCMDE